MTNILVFTGNAGPGIATAAAATALHAARQGARTLLLSFGPAHSLGALLGAQVGGEPAEIVPNLDALAVDGLAELSAVWERGRAQMPAALAQIAGDELPVPPGLEMSFGLLRLRDLAPRYECVVLDAGPHDALLRALALPDGLRWGVRLLFGLDRGPGRSAASVGAAVLPTSFMPSGMTGNVQDLRVQAERLRALLNTPSAAARFVLRPDRAALAEARLAIPALQLHGLAVPAIVAGPLSSNGLGARQDALLAEASTIWPRLPLLRFGEPDGEPALDALAAAGTRLDGDLGADVAAPVAPIVETWEGAPAVAVALPGLPKDALKLTLSGDDLIVQVGPYRRHILLPEGLRGITSIRATREGDRLVVRRRGA